MRWHPLLHARTQLPSVPGGNPATRALPLLHHREGAPDPETTVAVLIEAVRSLMQRHRGVLRLLRGQGRVNDRNLADSASQAVSIGRHACTAGADQCRSPPARPSSHRGLVRERRGRRERERPAGLDAHSHVKQVARGVQGGSWGMPQPAILFGRPGRMPLRKLKAVAARESPPLSHRCRPSPDSLHTGPGPADQGGGRPGLGRCGTGLRHRVRGGGVHSPA